MDIYSTILEVGGAKNPEGHVVDGFSLRKQLSGQLNPQRPDHFMCHFPHSHRSSYFTSYRKGDWKLIYRYLTTGGKRKSKDPLPKYELYDLGTDPYETNNLALRNRSKVNEMVQLMKRRLQTENALLPSKVISFK